MNTELNRKVMMAVRKDLAGRGEVVYVPWDMSEEEIAERFPEKLKAGLVNRLSRSPIQFSRDEYMIDDPEKIAKLPAALQLSKEKFLEDVPGKVAKRIIIQAPPSIQAWPPISLSDIRNTVSGPCGGPTYLRHVQLTLADYSLATRQWNRVGVHISRTKEVGPFEGDMTIFVSRETVNLTGVADGEGIVVQASQSEAGNLASPTSQYEFFPRTFIPFENFYVNFSWIISGGLTGTLSTVSFEPAEIMEGEKFGLQAIQRRWPVPKLVPAEWKVITVPSERVYTTRAPVPTREVVVREPPAPKVVVPPVAKVPEKRRFKNYAEIKVLEATGYTIVWATLRNTGEGAWGFPLEVTVVKK